MFWFLDWKILLDSAKLATMVKNKLAYCMPDSIGFVVIFDLLIGLDFRLRLIHQMKWLLVSAKIFSVVIHVVFLVSIANE